jgi:hypothetical protein
MTEDTAPRKALYIASILSDHLLLGMALLFLIPPVASNAEPYSFWGAIPWMLLCLGGSRYLAIRRGEETWFGLVLKAILFSGACFGIYLRVFGPH